jgi:hypothetical protein
MLHPSEASKSKRSLVVPNPLIVYLIVSFDANAHDDVDIEHDFPSMFENAQTNQVVDLDNFNHALTNVINRWGFQLKVEHQTYA